MSKFARTKLWCSIVVIVTLVMLSRTSLAQYYKPGETRSEPGADPLKAKLDDLRGVGTRLAERIKTATTKLNEVAKFTDPSAQEAQVDAIFVSMREEVNTVLEKLGSNSELMDALGRAKAGTIVLKDWFAGQPDSYPKRDETVQQLEEQLVKFDESAKQLQEGRAVAQNHLTTIMQQQRVIIQQLKVGKVRDAVAAVQSVLGDLGNLTEVLAVVSNANITTPVRVAQ